MVLDPGSLKTRESANFDKLLEQVALKNADLSRVAAGDNNLYLTLNGEPFLVRIEKT